MVAISNKEQLEASPISNGESPISSKQILNISALSAARDTSEGVALSQDKPNNPASNAFTLSDLSPVNLESLMLTNFNLETSQARFNVKLSFLLKFDTDTGTQMVSPFFPSPSPMVKTTPRGCFI